MSVDKLKQATGANGTAVVKADAKSFPGMLKQFQGEIERALPKHMNADRMARIALTEWRKNPQLGNCKPESVFAAVIMLSQLGLEPGVLGQSYLIPYGKECQAIPGWKGLVDLVSRTGRATIMPRSVYAGDIFDYEYGTAPFIKHKVLAEPEHRADFTHVYAIGKVRGAEESLFDVWTHNRVVRHRDRFNKVGDKHYSFQHFEQYGKKVVLLQVIKYLPASPELQTALDLEFAADQGSQRLDIGDVIDGTWTSVPTEPTPSDSGGESPGGREPQFNEQSAIEKIKAQKTQADVEAVFDIVRKDFELTKRDMPPSIDGAAHDRIEAIKQQQKI